MRTAAPATTAPLGSVTVPCTLPRSTCAKIPQVKARVRSSILIEFPQKAGFRRYYHLRRGNAIGILTVGILVSLAPSQVLPRLLEEGRNAFRDQDWPNAERLFLEAINSQPNRAWPYKWLGMTYAAQEKFELSEPPFRRACEIDPKEPDVCYYWGRTLFSLSRFDAALRAYEKDSQPWRGKTLLGMALALEALNRDT